MLTWVLWWISWGFAGYVWVANFRVFNAKGKLPKVSLREFVRGLVLSLLFGPFCFLFLTYLLIRHHNDSVDE